MPGLCDIPYEIVVLIAASEHEPSNQANSNAAPHLSKRAKSGSSLEPILQPPDLAAWARTCHQFYSTILPLLYEFNRTIQESSAVAWAAENGCVPALDKSKEHGLSLVTVQNLIRIRGWPPGLRPLAVGNVHPVQLAVPQGHTETVAWFLDHGVDVNAKMISLCSCPINLAPLLHTAICGHQQAVVRLLVERGARLDYNCHQVSVPHGPGAHSKFRTKFNSALHEAAKLNQADTVEYLVRDAGVDIQSCDDDGNSALICAIHDDEIITTVQKLLALGAPVVGRTSKWEDSALCYAVRKGHFSISGAITEACSNAAGGISKKWCTKALLWSVLKMSPSSDVDDRLSEIMSDRSCSTSISTRRSITSRSTNISYITSTSSSGSDSDSMRSELMYDSVRYMEPSDPWNIKRKSFMLKMIELGVDLENKGKPILAFSQEGWVTQLLLDAGADPNTPRQDKWRGVNELPLSLTLQRHYPIKDEKLWMENATVLLEHGARIDQPSGPTNSTALIDALEFSMWRNGRSKLGFLLEHVAVTQEQLDEAVEFCFQYRFVEGCRELTRYGARGMPSRDAIYDMAKDLIRKMNSILSKPSPVHSESSLPDELEENNFIAHKLSYLNFLLGYELSPIQMVILLAQAITQKVVDAAHILLDHGVCRHEETARYLTHLLILAAELGDLGVIRRLYFEVQAPIDVSLALQMAIIANHRAVILFLISQGAEVLQGPPITTYEAIEYLPSEEGILKRKEKWTEGWWERQPRKQTRLTDSLKHLRIEGVTGQLISALQLAVYLAGKDILRSILCCLSAEAGKTDKIVIHIPCVLTDAVEIRDLLAGKEFLSSE